MKIILVGNMPKEEITIMSEKGQIVIPKEVREQLKLKPKTRFIVIGYDDTIMLRKLEISSIRKELESLWKEIDKKMGERRITQKEIDEEIQRYRREKRKT